MDIDPVALGQVLVSITMFAIVVHVVLGIVAYLIYFERKISAYIQDRIGPNRVGFDFGLPFLSKLKGVIGLGQPLADGIKFLIKEDYTPENVDKKLFTLAPLAIIVPALIGFAVIPWGGIWEMPAINLPVLGTVGGGPVHVSPLPVNAGIIYLLAVASVGVYGVTLGGWASNNKYSFLGGLRATAQMISYEIPLGLGLLCVLLVVGSLLPERLIQYQVDHGWMVLAQPLAALIFFLAILAEANRAPFDNAEAEQELVGGYHTEYSAMRFALFFLAEYGHMITSSAFFALLFLGGYHLPGVFLTDPASTGILAVLAKFTVYLLKVVLLICFQMVIRWTIPRIRYDQVMMLAWQGAIPMGLLLVVVTSFMVYWDRLTLIPLLVANIVTGAVVWVVLPFMPRSTRNHRVALPGSRFCPPAGTSGETAPSHPMALEDRPVQGTVPTS